jgi:hypothetical protein
MAVLSGGADLGIYRAVCDADGCECAELDKVAKGEDEVGMV